MPLTMLKQGMQGIVTMCRAKDNTRKYLENLGILPGTKITVISEMNGDLIISVKGARLAINKGIAHSLHVSI